MTPEAPVADLAATGTSCVAITGATATTYEVAAEVEHKLTVQVTATDADQRSGHATSSPTAKVT